MQAARGLHKPFTVVVNDKLVAQFLCVVVHMTTFIDDW